MFKTPFIQHLIFLTALCGFVSSTAYADNNNSQLDNKHKLEKRLSRLEDLQLNQKTLSSIEQAIQNGEFDKVFTLYHYLQNEKSFVTHLDKQINNSAIVDSLALQQEKLVDTISTTLNTHKYIGQAASFTKPDVLVVLGGWPADMKIRLDQTLALAKNQYPELPIIITGKPIEIMMMKPYLISHGIRENRVVVEDQAKDTVGNALFSYLKASSLPSMAEKKRWLVITSRYHAPRTLYNFKEILPKEYTTAVIISPIVGDEATFRKKLTSEISSQSNLQFQESLRFPVYNQKKGLLDSKSVNHQPCDFLHQILQQHGLYKDNVDEISARNPQCNLN